MGKHTTSYKYKNTHYFLYYDSYCEFFHIEKNLKDKRIYR